jgi:hypothetical protein
MILSLALSQWLEQASPLGEPENLFNRSEKL